MPIATERVDEILHAIGKTRIGVAGDFCLDVYWHIDPAIRAVSVETDKPVQAVVDHHYSLGGGGNVAANIARLAPASLRVFAIAGDDPFGREMRRQLEALGADTDGLIVQTQNWITPVYAKPHIDGIEANRYDFGLANAIAPETEDGLLEAVERALPDLDVLVLNMQISTGYHTERVLKRLNELANAHPDCLFLVDSRFDVSALRHMMLKLNDLEAAKLCGERNDSASFVTGGENISDDDAERYARAIASHTARPVCVTRGARGMVLVGDGTAHHIPGIQIAAAIDTVGAGDTVAAALATTLASGATLEEAGQMANLAASVTVRKLRQTGTASPDEIREAARDVDYVYLPDLADVPDGARYIEETRIETVGDVFPKGRIRHAVFDHDGTVSTLREGWQYVMEPVMVRAILGRDPEKAPAEAVQRVTEQVREYIDLSTGIQTILQMQALVEMVRQGGHVPESEILDAVQYKQIYNDALMQTVDERVARLKRGDCKADTFIIGGAAAFLEALRERGARLYLASGTDEEDVRREAELLGYAHLFDGGIFGSVGDVTKYSKKMVIDRIIRENDLGGEELATFGDGPVELRETRKRGGICVGIASDEIHPGELDTEKRRRLIRAGAHLIVPDFSETEALLHVLWA